MLKGFKRSAIASAILVSATMNSPTTLAADQHWVQRINMSGVVEAEYGSGEGFDGTKSNDIAVATVEVGMEAKVNDKVNAYITLLHEEDDTDFSVDAAYIDVALGGMNLVAGQTVVPFGSFESSMLSDPVTLELAETPESILQLGTEIGPLQIAAYMFNGDLNETGGDDVADEMGFRLAFVTEGDSLSMDIGVDYINNIADSDGISGYLTTPIADGGPELSSVVAYVPAQIIHANISMGSVHLFFEHLITDQFDATEIPFGSKGAEITATNLEVAFDMNLGGMDTTLGVSMQSTEEAVALGMPKEKLLTAISFGIAKYTALTFEYSSSSDYDVADGGTGKDATSFTAQLAVGF